MKKIYLLIIVVLLVSCKKEKEDEQRIVKIKIENHTQTGADIHCPQCITFPQGSVELNFTQNKSNKLINFIYNTSLKGSIYEIPISSLTDSVYIRYNNVNFEQVGKLMCSFLNKNDSVIAYSFLNYKYGVCYTVVINDVLKFVKEIELN